MADDVKCAPIPGPVRSRPQREPRTKITWLLAAAALSAAPASATPGPAPGILFGGGVARSRAPVPLDPWLPTGEQVFSDVRRPAPGHEPAACSTRRPACVHRGTGVTAAIALRALAELERAYDRLVLALELPAPLGDLGRGGTDGLDLYLSASAGPELQVGHDAMEAKHRDQASAFCLVGHPDAASLARTATLCLGEAIALRLDAAESSHTRRAYAEHLWLSTGNPGPEDLLAIDEVQAHPERALLHRDRKETAEGAALVFAYLDAALSRMPAATLATSLLALSATKTHPRADVWENEPDIFDVWRATLKDDSRRMADMLVDLAVARAFLGSRSDGQHLDDYDWAQDFARIRFDWNLQLSSLPRRVASTHPIEPTGSVFVWLDLDEKASDMTLGFQAEWEPPVAFSWVLVPVDAQGRETARIRAPYRQRGTHTEAELSDLAGSRGVLVVGTNLGGTDPSHPFDPDISPFEGHGCTVYLTKL